MIKIIDNYLTDFEFDEIYNEINNEDFLWSFTKNVNNNCNENHFQFLHKFVEFGKEKYDNSLYIPKKIMKPYSLNKSIGITRAKANLFIKTEEKNIKLGYHKDIEDKDDFFTLLLYLEDSNGYTEFEDTSIVLSKKNRALIFKANMQHQTVLQTDKLYRTNININFKEI
jgi:hypothetical protein